MRKPKLVSDMDRALLFLYIKDVGLPPWAKNNEATVLSVLLGWSPERAEAALEGCFNGGLCSKSGEQIRTE